MRKYLPLLTILWLSAGGCAEPQAVVAVVYCSSADEFLEQLTARVPALQRLETAAEAEGWWDELSLPAEQIGVLGFAAAPGEWHVPALYLQGGWSRAEPAPFGERAGFRLRRFLRHIMDEEEVLVASDERKPCLIAAHATRAMAAEMTAKFKLRALFLEITTCDERTTEIAGETLADLVYLAGPRAVNLIWLKGEERRIVLAASSGEIDISPSPTQDELFAALPREKE